MNWEDTGNNDFILMRADWPAGATLNLLQGVREISSHVVVVRQDRTGNSLQEYFYLFTVDEAVRLLQAAPPDTKLTEALNLHESGAAATANTQDPLPSLSPDRVVLLDGGSPVAYFNRTEESDQITRLSGSTRTSLQAELPDQIKLNESISLPVSLASDGGTSATGGLKITLPTDMALDIIVMPLAGFEILGPSKGTLMVQEGLPAQVVFSLQATVSGPGDVRVLAFHDNINLGYLELHPMVIDSGATGQGIVSTASLAPVIVRVPDLSMLIIEKPHNGAPSYTIQIGENPTLGLGANSYGPIPYAIDPAQYFSARFGAVDNLPMDTQAHIEASMLKMKLFGDGLAEILLPRELQDTIWSLRDQIKTVLVQSQDPWAPWELCRISERKDGRVLEGGEFLCERFAISRWIYGQKDISPTPTDKLTMRNLAIIVPDNSGLTTKDAERDFLLGLNNGVRTCKRVPAIFSEVYKEMSAGTYDCWHFTGHGQAPQPDPDWSVIWLEDEPALNPTDIVGAVANVGISKPLIFLNACESGRSGVSLAGIAGWAQKFLATGAAAFVGTYWSVLDKLAFEFAKEFYTRLLQGTPIGESVRQARLAIKATGNPTWLAYTVYADPFAAVAVPPSPGGGTTGASPTEGRS